MQDIPRLIEQIQADNPELIFEQADEFCWSPSELCVKHPKVTSKNQVALLLHEISHYQLQHIDYSKDLDLISHEADAWEYAEAVLGPKYGISIKASLVQDCMDTYRDWLHKRSLCPSCGHNGVQTKNAYSCINCRRSWKVNEARTCALRRG